jgi:hypothetical protein
MDVPEVVAMKTRSGNKKTRSGKIKRFHENLERKPTKQTKLPFVPDVNATMHSPLFINFAMEFLSCFLTVWLELRDVAILDTACCGRGERTYLLEVQSNILIYI